MNLLKLFKTFFQYEKTTNQEVLKIISEGAKIATEHAKLFKYNLDYSDESIKKVDKILLLLLKEYSNTKKESELKNFALIFGLYIIEVYERNHGKGYIERKLLASNEDSFPYHRNGNLIFPCIWCLNKINDAKSEDLWSKYNTFI